MEQDIDYKGYKIKIRQDDFSESPDVWGDENLFLIYSHRQFTVERKGFEPEYIYNNPEEFAKYHVFQVNAYIHSGVALSLNKEYPFSDRWDTSTTGYILADKSEFPDKEAAFNAANGLIRDWNNYLSGNVYGFIIEKCTTKYTIEKSLFDKLISEDRYAEIPQFSEIEDDWDEVESCWGYYEDPEESGLITEAKLVIDNLTKNG